MKLRFMSLGIVALATVAAAAAVLTLRPIRLRAPVVPGTAVLHAFGSRSQAQVQSPTGGKFDGALAELSRVAGRVDPAHPLAGLHSLSPAARFKLAADDVTPLVAIDAVTVGDPRQLVTALEALGLQHASLFANDVSGWLPVGALEAAAARDEVLSLRAAMPHRRTGAVTSQGDFVQHSAAVRSSDSLTGTGVTVGVLSDSFNCYAVYANPANGVPVSGYSGYAFNGFTADYATDESTGDLPAGVDVLQEADCLNYDAPLQPPFGDEGRAMLQIVHDVAPGASLAFYTAEGSGDADFANGITALAAAGAKVIADDVGYFDEPFYQDGIIAQAIDTVEAGGVAYFSAAGNDADAAYENTAPSFGATPATTGPNAGEYLLNVDTSGATTSTALPVTLAAMQPGDLTAIVLEWDQPYVTGAPHSGGATGKLDLCVTGATSFYTIQNADGTDVTCTGPNALGVDPVQILIIANPANASSATPQETLDLVVGFAGGAQPGRVKVAVLTDGQTQPPPLSTFATHSATIQGHPGAAGAAAVGAAFYFYTPACGTTPAQLEAYSSAGGTPILFDSTGTRLTAPVVRQKPDYTAPDGGNDTFLGFSLSDANVPNTNDLLTTSIAACQNDASFPNFFGTSAATPHAAGIAALMLQANSALTPAQIQGALRTSALPMAGATPNFNSGYGFVQADAAFALIPPGAPAISASAASVVAGTAVTLTWTSVNTSTCTASGSWSGAQKTAGTAAVTPTAAGTATYGLSCSNAAGASPVESATVTVTAPAASSGGGGSLEWAALAALMGVAGAAAGRRNRRAAAHSS